MACRIGIGSTAKIGGNLAQPFLSVKKDGHKRVCDKFMGNTFTSLPDAPKNLPTGCS